MISSIIPMTKQGQDWCLFEWQYVTVVQKVWKVDRHIFLVMIFPLICNWQSVFPKYVERFHQHLGNWVIPNVIKLYYYFREMDDTTWLMLVLQYISEVLMKKVGIKSTKIKCMSSTSSTLLTVWQDIDKECSDQRNCWFSPNWLQLYAHEYKALEVAGFDEHIRAYQERIEFDTKKLLSSLPEAKIERKRTKYVILIILCYVNLLKRWTFKNHTLTAWNAVWTYDWN